MVTLEALALVLALSGADDTVLLEFSATWCEPCRSMQPTVERLAREGYPIRQIDVDQQRALAQQHRVTALPTFVMLKGGREVARVVGPADYQRLRQMFPAPPVARSAQNATIRAQSPDATSAAPRPGSAADPREALMRASVRIRVDDQHGQSIGSGTIVDTHGREALVLTCAHIFRESRGHGPIHVDLFHGGQSHTVKATLISYDLDRDIGLVSVTPGQSIEPARIAPSGYRFQVGHKVYSIGCDHGDVPSLRESQITSIDRYLGPPNIEAAGEPAVGRSGGGLFSSEGYLIGVCNHADPHDQEGIYASLPTVHWELDRVGQRRVYDRGAQNIATNTPGTRIPKSSDSQLVPVAAAPPQPVASPSVAQQQLHNAPSQRDAAEIICIVRSRGDPAGGEQVYVLDHPSRDLLDRLVRESRSGLAARTPRERGLSGPELRPRGLPPEPGRPVVRAQSSDRP